MNVREQSLKFHMKCEIFYLGCRKGQPEDVLKISYVE